MTARFEHAQFSEQPDYTLEDLRAAFRGPQYARRRLGVLWEYWMGAGIILIERADVEQARKLGGIIDSTTLRERRDPSLIGPSEIQRISAAAGVKPREVVELLGSFAGTAALMKRLTGGWRDDNRDSAHDKPPPFWEDN